MSCLNYFRQYVAVQYHDATLPALIDKISKEGKDVYYNIHYFIADKHGGFKREDRNYWVGEEEILKQINEPDLKRIGYSRTTILFPDLYS